MSDYADLNEFARLLGDIVLFHAPRYLPKMLANRTRVANVDCVVDAVCKAKVVLLLKSRLYIP